MSGPEVLTCQRCGADWERPRTTGPKPATCTECEPIRAPRKARPRAVGLVPFEKTGPGQALAANVVRYRLAIVAASAAIRIGRYAEALDILYAADPTPVPRQRSEHGQA